MGSKMRRVGFTVQSFGQPRSVGEAPGMKLYKLCFLLIVSVLCSSVAGAQAQNESLLIGSGDLLHIIVFDTPELEQHVRVTDSGDLPLMLVGTIHVAGLTPGQASALLNQKLISGHFMLSPQASISVEQYATASVSVLGEVKLPGSYFISAPRTVLDMVAIAGGLTPAADRQVTIKQKGQADNSVRYFLSNDATKAIKDDVLVHPGDTIVVPKAGIVYVLGDVRMPGGYVMNNNNGKLTVLQMVATAGGANNSAVLSHVRLVRRESDGTYSTIPLQLGEMQKGKQPDVPLYPSDIVYVPFSFVKNAAIGSTGGIVTATSSALIYTR
jgi:polysaccharide export outer membrane protein